jgi:predicted permease
MRGLIQDIRFGARLLGRNVGFTIAAVLALGLGIGVNTAAFTAYKALFVRPLDARDAGSMVNLALTRRSGVTDPIFSYPDYQVYRDQLRSFTGVIAAGDQEFVTLSGAGGRRSQRGLASGSLLETLGMVPPSAIASDAEQASVMPVSENYFSVLGVTAERGRTFDGMSSTELHLSPPVLISANYWQRRFGGDTAILGKVIRLNGAAFTIIGIAPLDFVGTSVGTPDFWFPISLTPLVHAGSKRLEDREDACCRMFARLAAGVTLGQAQAEMDAVANRLRLQHKPESDAAKPSAALVEPGSPLPRKLPGPLQFTLLLIQVAIGLVLVIACANVASLQLARSAARQSELSMRLSLGASRQRLIRQLLTESALLGMVAGGIAFLITWALLKELANAATAVMPANVGDYVVHVTPDLGIFTYVLAISFAAGLLFGLVPALESSRSALSSALKSNTGSSPRRSRRLRDLLIGAQVAFSLVLMIAGSMLIRSSLHTLKMETGYADKQVACLYFKFPEGFDYSPERKAAVLATLSERLRALPGVVSVTNGRAPDGDGMLRTAVSLSGQEPTAQNARAYLYYSYVQPNYFETLGIPLLFGRGFSAQSRQPEFSAILSESAARRLWPGENAIGRSFRMDDKAPFVAGNPTYHVIGIVRDTRAITLDGSDTQQIYIPLPTGEYGAEALLIRTRFDAAQLLNAIPAVVGSVDPMLLTSASTLEEMLRQTPVFWVSSLLALIASATGTIGLLLAAMGIYGTVSYIVVLRTREVGIRLAIGAQKSHILALMLRETTRPVIAGLCVGAVLAAGASFLLRGALFGVHTIDGLSCVFVSLLFLAIALLAAYVPSRRAMQVDPVVALRYE